MDIHLPSMGNSSMFVWASLIPNLQFQIETLKCHNEQIVILNA